MKTKTCSKCSKDKILDDFYNDVRQSSGKRPECKECNSTQGKTKYATDEVFREKKLANTAEQNRTRRREMTIRVLTILKHTGCKDCGETNPVVLDFDHMRDKTDGISRMIRNHASWETIELEIAKCEVRCACCHRKKTALERGYYDGIDLSAL